MNFIRDVFDVLNLRKKNKMKEGLMLHRDISYTFLDMVWLWYKNYCIILFVINNMKNNISGVYLNLSSK
jgi:hypothetical protein